MNKPKILILDIETSYIVGRVWGVRDQNLSINQIEKDWTILSWSAKWLDEKESFYADQRGKKNIRDDKELLKPLYKLLDEADAVIGHNVKSFDLKKIRSRFILNGFKPMNPVRAIDTLTIARKNFKMTYNSLEYLCEILDVKFKKLKHKEFPGMDLWNACLADNLEAWKVMEKYNRRDVLATEEVYKILSPWENSINHSVYADPNKFLCSCGNTKCIKHGFHWNNSSKFQRYECTECGKRYRGVVNLLEKGSIKYK